MNMLLWVGALLTIGLGVMALEVFVPSGGILGFISILALVAAVATAFAEQGVAGGMAVLAVVVLAVPVVLGLALRWFPETPLGRRVLTAPDAADVVPDAATRRHVRDLVGRHGRAVSELLPWGSVEIDGERLEAVSEGGPIDSSEGVEVVGVEGRAVVVRRLEAVRAAAASPALPSEPAPPAGPSGAAAADAEPASALSPTLETFDFDGLDDRA
jgi:membrane-bound serine protease (ClpP class)